MNTAPIIAKERERKTLGTMAAAFGKGKPGRARLVSADGSTMILPDSLYKAVLQVVRQLAEGNGVSILPITAELTTQEASAHLNISRPSLIKLLEQNAMPFHMVGTHRRVYLRDLISFKQKRDSDALTAIRRLADEAQELGIYDE